MTLSGIRFDSGEPLNVAIGAAVAQVVFASPGSIVVVVPVGSRGGDTPIREAGGAWTGHLHVGKPWATGLHQVDSPVFDSDGNLLVTYSGPRGQESPVSVFRVTPSGTRLPFVSGIVNATSMAYGPDGALYVSSRFDGAVYKIDESGTPVQVASDLGVACGLAFDSEGDLFVGDRSGTIFRVREGSVTTFASLPASVAAFHVAMSAEDELFVTAPTLGSYDYVYRIGRDGEVGTLRTTFGRPQGLAFAPDGSLYIADALSSGGGVYRLAHPDAEPQLAVAGSGLVGVAFGPGGAWVVVSNQTAYRFDVMAGDTTA